jgi:hypothetical protein
VLSDFDLPRFSTFQVRILTWAVVTEIRSSSSRVSMDFILLNGILVSNLH